MASSKSSGLAMPWAPSLRPATSSPSLRPASSGSSSPWSRASTPPTPRSASSSPPASRGWDSVANQSRPSQAINAFSSGNWRANAAPLPPAPPPPPPRPECIPGRVVKLPEQHEVPVTSRFHKEATGMGQPWNHPVVITREWKDLNGEQLVSIRSCTSWGGQGIAAKKQYHHHYYVVADQITLDSGKFDKPTYVNCSPGHELTIEFKHLQLWTGKAIQFKQWALDSFDKNEPPTRRDSGCYC